MTRLNTQSITLHRRGSGPPLVLLHCLGVDHHFWRFADDLALASNIKGARLEWIGKARHASVIERPSEALAIIRNFLRG
jgi:hypothetical protein